MPIPTNPPPSAFPPLRPVPYWFRLLGDLLGDVQYSTPGEQHQPDPVDDRLLTTRFSPEEVSSNADERLFIFTAFAGAGYVVSYNGYPPATAHVFNLVMGGYRAWDAEGVAHLSDVGRGRALEYLEDLLHY